MDGMSTQELLKGQDLSSANVDDLLAALRQEEGRPVESPVDEIIRHEHSNTKAESGPITDLPDLDAILAASHEAEKVEMEQAAAAVETPAENLDTILNAEIDALSGNPTPAEEAMAEMAPEVDMALTEVAPEMPVVEAMPEAAPEAVAEEPMNMDALMNAMVGEAPAAEAAPEMPVAEAAPEIPAEAIPETAMDMALTEPVEIPEEAPMFEPSMEAVALAEGASLEINEMNDMEESITNVENMTEETNEVVGETQQMSEESAKELLSQFEETAEDLAQTPAELDMDKAADALGGAVEDIENFLETESYEYTTITEDQKTFLILKADDGTAMAIIYDSDEFDSVNLNFDKNGKTVYKEIMNTYIKEIIRTGGSIGINRHRGTKVVTR